MFYEKKFKVSIKKFRYLKKTNKVKLKIIPKMSNFFLWNLFFIILPPIKKFTITENKIKGKKLIFQKE